MVDAVFVGAGHNALACAAALATKGWRVAVYERADTPGGAVKTREATLPGFRHDMGAMNLSLFAGSEFNCRFGAELAGHGLDFVPVRDCFATAFPDGRWFGVSTDPNITAARVAGFSTADADRWLRMAEEFRRDAPDILQILGAAMMPLPLARAVWSIRSKRGTRRVADLARLFLQSPRGFLEENFESGHIRAALAVWGMHLDFPPDQGGGALFPYLEAMANQSFGMALGRGGADTLTKSLVAMIEAHGGVVECGAEATSIAKEGGRARTARLADGREVTASKAVIAGVAPSAVPRLMGGSTGDARYDRAVTSFVYAPGTMMIHLAMDGPPDWAAGAELKRFAYVHLAPSMRQMAAAHADARAGLLPSEPVLVVGQPTAVDPSRAPAGKHVLWVQVRMVPGVIRGDAAGEIDARDWEAAKAPMTERCLDILERYAPGVRTRILGRASVSPVDLEAENPNLIGGDQLCGSHHPWQNFLFRPAFGHADWSTPVPGLHLIGAGTWPGAGVGAGSGMGLAKRLARF